MGFRHCCCLTGLFGLSLVPLFMKPEKKMQIRLAPVLLVLDDRKLHLNKTCKPGLPESFCQLFIVEICAEYVTTEEEACMYLKCRKIKFVNLKSHEYSDVKVGQPHSLRCFRVFQLYSSVTHFVLWKNSSGRGFICFAKDFFQHELLASDQPLSHLSCDMCVGAPA